MRGIHFERAIDSRSGGVCATERVEGLSQLYVVGAAGTGLGIVAPEFEGRCEGLPIVRALVEECEFTQGCGRKAVDAGRVFVVAYRAIDLFRMIARDFSGSNQHLEASVWCAVTEHFDFALVEVERAAPIFHCLEQLLKGSQRCEVLGVGFERRGIGSACARGRMQSAPADVSESAQQGSAPGRDGRCNVFEFVFESLGDLRPTSEALEVAPQCAQRGCAERIPLQHLSIGGNRGSRQVQSLGAQAAESEPAFRIVRLSFQVRCETDFEFDPVALNLEQPQQRIVFRFRRLSLQMLMVVAICQCAEVVERGVGAPEFPFVDAGQFSMQFESAIVEYGRLGVEGLQFFLRTTRPGARIVRVAQCRSEFA